MRFQSGGSKGWFIIFDGLDLRPKLWGPPSVGFYAEHGSSWPMYPAWLTNLAESPNAIPVPNNEHNVIMFDPPNESEWPSWAKETIQ